MIFFKRSRQQEIYFSFLQKFMVKKLGFCSFVIPKSLKIQKYKNHQMSKVCD